MTKQAFDADVAAACVVEAMRPLTSATRAVQEKRYLKSDLDFLGVAVRRLPGAEAARLQSAYKGTYRKPAKP